MNEWKTKAIGVFGKVLVMSGYTCSQHGVAMVEAMADGII
jgi:hypothetical protein